MRNAYIDQLKAESAERARLERIAKAERSVIRAAKRWRAANSRRMAANDHPAATEARALDAALVRLARAERKP